MTHSISLTRRPVSLTRRLVLRLIGAQVFTYVAIFVFAIAFDLPAERNWIGTYYALIRIGEHVERAEDGTLRLREDSDLRNLRRDNPELWFVISDGKQVVAEGKRPPDHVLSANIAGLNYAEVRLAGQTDANVIVAERTETPVGDVLIELGGVRSSVWLVLNRITREWMVGIGAILCPILLAALVAAWVTVRSSLRTLRPVTEAASRVDTENRGERLPERNVPEEVLPLVRTVNAALSRLDEGYNRQRRFLADAAHELRTPIAVLRTRLETLPAGAEKAKLQHDVTRLTLLADQLLDLERLHRSAARFMPVDLVAITREVAADFAPLVIEGGSELEFDAAPGRVRVLGDTAAIRSSIANLVSNALTHAGGRGTIRIRALVSGTVEVEDDGPGIPVGARESVFEPFRRLAGTGTGSGLGLHLVREILELHGGRVELEESPSGGCLFRLVFPLVPVRAKPAHEAVVGRGETHARVKPT